MMKHFYLLSLALVFSNFTAQAERWAVAKATLIAETPILQSPDIGAGYVNGTEIGFDLNNPNESGSIEVYRSKSGGAFQKIATVPYNQPTYVDRGLKPRTTYSYKIRAVSGTESSAFSNTVSITTNSIYYSPIVSTKVIDSYTVEISITDRTYYEGGYEIEGVSESHENDLWQSIGVIDSGSTVKIIHHPTSAGTTYTYSLWVWPEYGDDAYFTEQLGTATTPRDQYCSATGEIERERWDNIPGYGVGLIPTYQNPSLVTTLSSFSTPANEADNYGARVRGFVCAPQTGDYVFYISSDDNSELWLSTDERPMNKRLIASSKWTYPNQWDKYTTQQSAAIHLESGKKYYIEALHKENTGADHLAVGWKLPSGVLERPIGGNRLSKLARNNYPPNVVLTNPKHGEQYNAPANILISANASDPDGSVAHVDFSINGQSVAQDFSAPYQYQWNNITAGEYTVYATAFDNEGQSSSYGAYIYVKDPPQCAGTGKITREYWWQVPGTSLSAVNFNTPPNTVNSYTSFETEANSSRDNYGSRMRGYVCVPFSGNYTFFISSDDQSQLYLSTDDTPANKRKIAYVDTYTGYRVYNKFTSQKSAPINLVAGKKYYIEALHKEGKGNDFISVAWQLPNGTTEAPIPGNRLINLDNVRANQGPDVTITSPTSGQRFTTFPANILVKATATDPETNGGITKVDFFLNGEYKGTDTTYPYEFTISNVPRGEHEIGARAYDNSSATDYDAVMVVVESANTSCAGAGKISREVWTNAPGTTVAEIPVNRPPDQKLELTSFETPNYYGNDYGQRIRGYVCPARTGQYMFYIASDDASELWLSTDDNPANKVKIAYLNTAVTTRNWFTPRPEQSSDWIQLTAGTKYYIEALHKEGRGDDHLSVAWRFEDYSVEGPIGGDKLLPYVETSSSSMLVASTKNSDGEMLMSEEESDEIAIYPNPTSSREFTISLGDVSWKGDPRIEIISSSGRIVQSSAVECDKCKTIGYSLDPGVTSGLYLVNVVLDRRRLTRKLQVK